MGMSDGSSTWFSQDLSLLTDRRCFLAQVSAYLCKVGVETIVWKEIKVTSINSAANYHENQFFSRKTINTYIYLKRNQ